eukprot:GHVU01150978.1.p1 GENE.GHVU01150978.1~~GHVU01150978.1.p1  ORF type:complete len:169 (-),score=9.47 GHVU01150978.1:236-742(-)
MADTSLFIPCTLSATTTRWPPTTRWQPVTSNHIRLHVIHIYTTLYHVQHLIKEDAPEVQTDISLQDLCQALEESSTTPRASTSGEDEEVRRLSEMAKELITLVDSTSTMPGDEMPGLADTQPQEPLCKPAPHTPRFDGPFIAKRDNHSKFRRRRIGATARTTPERGNL